MSGEAQVKVDPASEPQTDTPTKKRAREEDQEPEEGQASKKVDIKEAAS